MVQDNNKIFYASIHNKNVWLDSQCDKEYIHGVFPNGVNIALPGEANDEEYKATSKFIISKLKYHHLKMVELIFSTEVD